MEFAAAGTAPWRATTPRIRRPETLRPTTRGWSPRSGMLWVSGLALLGETLVPNRILAVGLLGCAVGWPFGQPPQAAETSLPVAALQVMRSQPVEVAPLVDIQAAETEGAAYPMAMLRPSSRASTPARMWVRPSANVWIRGTARPRFQATSSQAPSTIYSSRFVRIGSKATRKSGGHPATLPIALPATSPTGVSLFAARNPMAPERARRTDTVGSFARFRPGSGSSTQAYGCHRPAAGCSLRPTARTGLLRRGDAVGRSARDSIRPYSFP
jgi:hypothetical protein